MKKIAIITNSAGIIATIASIVLFFVQGNEPRLFFVGLGFLIVLFVLLFLARVRYNQTKFILFTDINDIETAIKKYSQDAYYENIMYYQSPK